MIHLKNVRALGFALSVAFASLSFLVISCGNDITETTDDDGLELPENPFSAPLYWSVYENHILQPDGQDNYISEEALSANIDWVEENLLPYGYSVIAMDGWGDVSKLNEHGYRVSHSRHWEHDYSWWADHLQSRGMNLGMYDNPLWVHLSAVDAGAKVTGTDIPLGQIIDRDEESLWFTWVQVDRDGAEEYVRGCVEHYADMGIRFLNVDFLSWFEDGFDKNLGNVGPDRTQEDYVIAMRWIREEADEHGILFKAVMPALNNEAEVERRHAHMIRINEDVSWGTRERFSEDARGKRRNWWSQWANPMDGYAYWSHISGREKIILDGDFIRLNTFNNDDEKKAVVSQHLMAGGPLGIADQHNTIGDGLWLLQNEEMLALNHDGFVGKPLDNDPTSQDSQIWTGQMSNGDWIVALFNRESTSRTRHIDFATALGLEGEAQVRDLWEHEDLGLMTSLSADVPPRGVVVVSIVN
ncbi:MAG: DUF5116 domain-containing protein [Candidatus Eisenbacteria bacterium]